MPDTLAPEDRKTLEWLQQITTVDLRVPPAPDAAPVAAGTVLSAADDDAKRRTAKTRALKEATDFVMGFRDQIQADLAKTVGDKQKQAFLNVDRADADSEFDFVADRDDFDLTMDVEFDRALQGWMDLIYRRADQLRDAWFDGAAIRYDGKPDNKGKPLFSPQEVRKDFLEPLVRARIMPSTLVSDDMSETMQTFANADRHYGERLKKHTEAQTEDEGRILTDDNKRVLGLVGKSLETCSEAAVGVVNNIAKAKSLSATERAHWNDIALVAMACVKGAVAASDAAMEGRGDVATFLEKSADIAAASAALALESDPQTAKIVSASIKVFGKSAKLAGRAMDRDPDGACDALAEMVGGAFDVARAKTTDRATQDKLKIAATTVAGLIKQMGKVPELVEAWHSGDAGKLRTAFVKLLVAAMNNAAAGLAARNVVEENRRTAAEERRTEQERDERDERTREGIEEHRADLERTADRRTDLERDAAPDAQAIARDMNEVRGLEAEIRDLPKDGRDDGRKADRDGDAGDKDRERRATLEAELRAADRDLAEDRDRQADHQAELREARDEARSLEAQLGALEAKLESDHAADEADDRRAEIDDLAKEKNQDRYVEGMAEGADKAAEALGELDEALQKQIEAVEDRLREQRLTRDKADMEALIGQARTEEADPLGAARPTLKKIMDKLARDRAIFAAVDALIGGGASIAAQFFPGAGAIIAYKEFVQNFVQAIQHTKLFRDWRAAQSEALGAAFDALASAELNRAGLEEKYMAEDWTLSALGALDAIGQTLAAGTPLAPVGFAISAAAKGAKAATKVTFAGIREADLRKAWTDYQAALEKEIDRKAMRAALRANPTLAKYAIAWAAIEDKNPLARAIVKNCNLTDAVLADPDSNTETVVAYMEMLFNRDPIVLKRVPVRKKVWWPCEIEPTPACWIRFVQAARKYEADPLPKVEMGSVLAALAHFEEAADAAKAAKRNAAADQDEKQRAQAAAKDDLRAALAAFKPAGEGGEPHKGMLEVAAEFAKAADGAP